MKIAKTVMIVLVIALMIPGVLVQAQGDDPLKASSSLAVATTEAGQLQGFINDGIYTFRGVQYAQAERFMMPEAVEPWEGVKSALLYGESCPIAEMTEVSGDDFIDPHRYLPENENCQYLNIWTPGIQDDAKRPVMVWLHGGGWSAGSGIEMMAYDGTNLSKKGDVVVITLNHRLNVLGYLDLSAYGEEYKYSGNVGVADMVAALEWIQANIAEFGGDPDNVTIFGQSGGGAKVATLMTVPAADGLVDKGIMQSGGMSFRDQAISQELAAVTIEKLGIAPEQIDEIKDVPYDDLLAAATEAISEVEGAGWGPVLDGDYIPEPGFTEQANDIPLMIGNVLDEFWPMMYDPIDLMADNSNNWTEEYATEKLEERFGENGAAIGQAFVEAYPQKQYADAYFVYDRSNFVKLADLKSQQDAPVYSYVFTYFTQVLDGVPMAWHCSEIPYVFNNVELAITATGGGSVAQAMADTMSQAWINFARYGDPNHDRLPEWPAYTTENGATMILDNVSYVGYHHDAELLALMSAE